jgi:lysophospholipase L1-like esterase
LTKKIVVSLLLIVLAACPGTAAGAPATPSPQAEIFEWSMPGDFGIARDEQNRIVETQPSAVGAGPWVVDLKVTGSACATGATYKWEVDKKRVTPEALERPCAFRYRVPIEGTHIVRLVADVGGTRLVESQKVVVQDWLIVSIGDSVASGEGVPDIPGFFRSTWQSARCHRSALAAPALAAKRIEEEDSHSSVTFVHLACSGAEAQAGLLQTYRGAVPPNNEPPLPPQVDELNQIASQRQVDAVLLSIGANDIHFSDIVSFCAKRPRGNCFTRRPYKGPGGDGSRSAEEIVAADLAELRSSYGTLAGAISNRIAPAQIHIVEYFDPTRNARGEPCGHILSIGKANVELAQSKMLVPLNEAVAAAADANRWDMVSGVEKLFRTHGYCAGKQAWVSSLGDSLWNLGGIAGKHRGTLHPNAAGHEATSELIAKALDRDLYGAQTTTPAPPLEPTEEDTDDSGSSFAWPSGILILLGIALGAAILVWWPITKLAARPLLSLAKTFRPLLLPLLVVLAVGTVNWSLLAQVLISAALLVVAWMLIVVPEAKKSEVKLRPERELGIKIAIYSAIALVLGILAVLGVKWLAIDNPYFAAIGDVPSGLLLLALVTWAFALLFRLFSFATTRLRAVLAFDIGLALIVLAIATGLAPGHAAVHDAWPQLFGIFAISALVLLAVEAVRAAIAGPPPQVAPPASRPLTSRAAGLGFSLAAVAAVVIAASTGTGLVAAADKGKPLNPPEEESAEARLPLPRLTAGDGALELAEKYSPVLAFTKDEHWAPVRVEGYLANATLDGPPGTPEKVKSVAELPRECPEFGQSRCYTLSINCESGGARCAHGSSVPRESDRLYSSGTAYVRVLKKGAIPPYEPRGAFANSGPFRDELAMLIQYWYFYYYDEWRAPVFAGVLIQRHEGDWETVTIGLDEQRRPLFVADSAHCSGSWRPWHDVEVSTLPPGPHIHPLVAVAEGSHANYPAAAQKRAPDWANCAGAPAGATSALSFASNIRDKTEYGWPWYPRRLVLVDGNTAPMTFPGTWGADDRTTLRNFRSTELGKRGLGPKTPTLQGPWQEPVRAIFCGKYTPRDCDTD